MSVLNQFVAKTLRKCTIDNVGDGEYLTFYMKSYPSQVEFTAISRHFGDVVMRRAHGVYWITVRNPTIKQLLDAGITIEIHTRDE